jgi:hypothetical protein
LEHEPDVPVYLSIYNVFFVLGAADLLSLSTYIAVLSMDSLKALQSWSLISDRERFPGLWQFVLL